MLNFSIFVSYFLFFSSLFFIICVSKSVASRLGNFILINNLNVGGVYQWRESSCASQRNTYHHVKLLEQTCNFPFTSIRLHHKTRNFSVILSYTSTSLVACPLLHLFYNLSDRYVCVLFYNIDTTPFFSLQNYLILSVSLSIIYSIFNKNKNITIKTTYISISL